VTGETVVCGLDGSAAGFEALRQAIRLLPDGGRLLALTVYDPAIAVHGGWDAPRLAEQIVRDAGATRDEAAAMIAALPGGSARLAVGDPAAELMRLARRTRASLIAVGTHGHSRAAGIVVGGVTATLLHEAPCPVLVARPAHAAFPRTIAVGSDGSRPARRALLTASELAVRFGVGLRVVAASGGRPVDVDGLRSIPHLAWSDRDPVSALVDVSRDVDLLVVGSRGLHGPSALGSVSERVAHRAACSVLVVRAVAAAGVEDVAGAAAAATTT
jgi:nucleotide-binding universal stress UspA family protein